MAITLYKVHVDIRAYEDAGFHVPQSTFYTYKNPIYTTSLFRASCVRAKYGDEFCSVSTAEINTDWTPVEWEKINEMNVDVTKDV